MAAILDAALTVLCNLGHTKNWDVRPPNSHRKSGVFLSEFRSILGLLRA